MLARRLPSIMPPLEPEEALEVARVHSVAGLLVRGQGLPRRPFRAPHHSVSYAGLAGGGSPLRPGEISLAHRGVLFLDELPEYRRDVLEVLRQPMEEGWVRLARAGGAVRFPAQFLLVASMNPCPCGFLGDGSDRCRCDEGSIARYRGRVSGPLLDRVDLRVETAMPAVDRFREVESENESSAAVAARVARARRVQSDRLRHDPGVFTNAQLNTEQMRTWCRPTDRAIRMLRGWAEREGTSARGYDRVLRVARTIADLDGRSQIDAVHAGEALQYRLGSPR
jgi:magnesium chelatase family protein